MRAAGALAFWLLAACALCGWMLLRREHGLRRALAAARAAGKLD